MLSTLPFCFDDFLFGECLLVTGSLTHRPVHCVMKAALAVFGRHHSQSFSVPPSAWTNQNHDSNHESLFGQFQEIQNESIHLGDDLIHLMICICLIPIFKNFSILIDGCVMIYCLVRHS